MSFRKWWAATNNAPVTSQKPWRLLVLLILLLSPSHLLFIEDLSTRERRGGNKACGGASLPDNHVPPPIRWSFWRRCRLVKVTCEHSLLSATQTCGTAGKKNTPGWGEGWVQFYFWLCVRGWEGMINVCALGAAEEQMQFYYIHVHKGEHFNFIYSRGKRPSRVKDLM